MLGYVLLVVTRLSLMVLAGCSTVGGAVVDVAKAYYAGKTTTDYRQVPLRPGLIYLEVQLGTASALMTLAEIDRGQTETGALETWVSSQKEVFRTRAGFFQGASGVETLPELVSTQWLSGAPNLATLSWSRFGVHDLPMTWQRLPVNSRIAVNETPLFKRAYEVPGLKVSVWQAGAAEFPAIRSQRISKIFPILQVVATDPETGKLVYGQFCTGQSNCIEYLLRTSVRNL